MKIIMKNKALILILCGYLYTINILSIAQKLISETKISYSNIFSIPKEPIYLCITYKYRDKFKRKEMCNCHVTYKEILSFELGRKKFPPKFFMYFFVITDKNFILNEILPLCDEEIKDVLAYSYSNNNDTIFKYSIDYDNKIIIDENSFYYPLNMKENMQAMRIYIDSVEWFKLIIQKYSLKSLPNCITNEKKIHLFIYIPFLERTL
jgi:hypothetical protein